ncbi:hypothetical protein HJB89_25465 [Rhizobium sp. NZLR8]|uniref:hypothetical protein n=1 Tax=Rhizobium sp. NZLR8 TaxID=2731104 RepID=UPI001C8294AB|nr:hypothetical protein [Rhizobium sp. NZLR8]MBX5160437.1 hypothetical protein [Rhizobium sp. NZLR8]
MSEINETVHAVAALVARSKRVRANIEKAREALRIYLPGEHVELPFRRAVCHPLLGGILRKDEAHDIPGPSFTVNSLRRAADKGELQTSWHGSNQFTSAASLRDWIAMRQGARPEKAKVVQYLSPKAKTLDEKRQAKASVENATARLISMKAALAKKKQGK